jgi:hypothetical protein
MSYADLARRKKGKGVQQHDSDLHISHSEIEGTLLAQLSCTPGSLQLLERLEWLLKVNRVGQTEQNSPSQKALYDRITEIERRMDMESQRERKEDEAIKSRVSDEIIKVMVQP